MYTVEVYTRGIHTSTHRAGYERYVRRVITEGPALLQALRWRGRAQLQQ